MSKVQTFEELWRSTPISRIESEANKRTRATAEYWFRAGMENAARVCEDAASDWRHSGDDFSDAEYLAGAIREAAKR